MKKIVIALGVAILGLTSCKQFKQGEGDMMYKMHTNKGGNLIQIGDFVVCKLVEKTENDSLLFSSYLYDRPALLVREKSLFKGDLYAALGLLSEGDSASFKINADSMAAKMGRPKPKDLKGKYLVYTLKIDKVIPKGKLTDSLFQDKIGAFVKEETDKAKNAEEAKLKRYIAANNLKTTLSPSGLHYVVIKEGSGEKALPGDSVSVHYTGKLLTGKVFDTSVMEIAKKEETFNPMRPYEPLKIAVGSNSTIPGFEEGLMLFPKGTQAILILPSKLAYGEYGNQSIQPYTPLVFDIEIVNISHPKTTPLADMQKVEEKKGIKK